MVTKSKTCKQASTHNEDNDEFVLYDILLTVFLHNFKHHVGDVKSLLTQHKNLELLQLVNAIRDVAVNTGFIDLYEAATSMKHCMLSEASFLAEMAEHLDNKLKEAIEDAEAHLDTIHHH
ncbi:hypothetical protein [Algicola sagamiensis]|uniref:hypothetical protein n=1 Tax=Algicola sagamiensis TaxID=163869 RepID=UPI0003634714|nr:hypothetical protein [Algicola sagamiensis]